ncbi:MAG TPA: hypothetical protein VML75_13995 [Kofleriaceae bacterium]|nr:hypothetical protein [Kofleriaceae bacterium]
MSNLLPNRSLLALLCAVGVLAWTASAHAENKPKGAEAYWSIGFLGGVLAPQGDMSDTHKAGLAAGGRLGWTSRSGLGLYVAGQYSPLPRRATGDPVESFETHFGTLTLEPTFTLRWRRLRLWLSAGGGAAAERTRHVYRGMNGQRRTDYVPAASATAGLELHLFSGGGLVVQGNYTRLFGELGFVDGLEYEFANLTGGVVFLFR